MMSKQYRCGNECSDTKNGCQERTDCRINPCLWNIFGSDALILQGALLKEQHPGCHRCTDIGHDEQQQGEVNATRWQRTPGDQGMRYLNWIWMNQERYRN